MFSIFLFLSVFSFSFPFSFLFFFPFGREAVEGDQEGTADCNSFLYTLSKSTRPHNVDLDGSI